MKMRRISPRFRQKLEKCTELVMELKLIVRDIFFDADFFNIFLKLLVYSFLSQLVDPMFTTEQELTKDEN